MKRLTLFAMVIVFAPQLQTHCHCAQQADSSSGPNTELRPESQLSEAKIIDYDPSTRVGDAIFGSGIADNFESGRNSHMGPVGFQYKDGNIVAFYSNTNEHDLKGWTEYALSRDGGKTWDTGNRFDYSYEYWNTQQKPAFVGAPSVSITPPLDDPLDTLKESPYSLLNSAPCPVPASPFSKPISSTSADRSRGLRADAT